MVENGPTLHEGTSYTTRTMLGELLFEDGILSVPNQQGERADVHAHYLVLS